LCYKVITL